MINISIEYLNKLSHFKKGETKLIIKIYLNLNI
jgi:hypothetical protein